MCGILFSSFKDHNFKEALMLQSHRGPDYSGIDSVDGLLFGHNLLSIMGHVSESRQPFSIEDKTLVFNGAIYNYKKLRDKLKGLGHIFSTNTDTELLLRYYIQYGVNGFSDFDGMFAFLIYDASRKELVIARDRLGQKPMYYSHNAEGIRISSEVMPLVCLSGDKSLNESAITDFLDYGYFLEDTTPYNGIRQFSRNTVSVFSIAPDSCRHIWSDNIYKTNERFSLKKLRKSIANRLESDTEVGVFLSGGRDSTALLYGIDEKKRISLCLTASFNINDESDIAKETAARLDIDSVIHLMNNESILDRIKSIEDFIDIPYGDPSFLPLCDLAEEASKRGIRVMLTGDGADELLFGYKRYKVLYIMLFLVKIPLIGRLISMKLFQSDLFKWINTMKKESFSTSRSARFSSVKEYFSSEIDNYLKNNILVKSDLAGMRYGVEIRSPFLTPMFWDKDLNNISRFIRTYTSKWRISISLALKGDLRFLIAKKKGFTFDMRQILTEIDVKVNDCFETLRSHEIKNLNVKYLQLLQDNFNSGGNYDYRRVYRVYVLGAWLNR